MDHISSPPLPASIPSRSRIVIVEDNDDARDILIELLAILGYQSIGFPTTDGVLDALTDEDVLLTDVTLPGMSGIELARLAIERRPHLKVIFCSGRIVDDVPFDSQILPKPYTMESLRHVLGKIS